MFRQLNEVCDYIVAAATLEDRRNRFQRVLVEDQSFIWYLRCALDPAYKLVGIGEGYPARNKIDRDIPDGMGDTTLRVELRRVMNFRANGSAQQVVENKRISLWTVLLEGLHWKEADLLVAIKDGQLLSLYPKLEECLDLAGLGGKPEPVAPPPEPEQPVAEQPVVEQLVLEQEPLPPEPSPGVITRYDTIEKAPEPKTKRVRNRK